MNGSPVFAWIILVFVASGVVCAANLIDKSPSRCENICNNCKDLQRDLEADCQRGCQYFNILFLVSVSDQNKVSSIDTYEAKCKTSCSEAYDQQKRLNACFAGCSRMYEIQNQAPYINNWIIFMGESDKGMVLLPSDSETLNANDWLLLESFLRQDGENDAEETIVTDTIITERQASTSRDFFGHESMPWWMWCFPIVMFIIALWDCHIDSSARNVGDEFHHSHEIILNDKTIYPSLAVLPPKYSESEKNFLSESEDDDKCVKSVLNT
ncbi:unnamed protein product [Hermetia illucens]|uniref:Transmembrane protein 59 n=1 Tax=Hermetia illucens TaxID=343691 RepID=A0A7R8V1R2_HERIL|nr:uncharacterized protein LOC119658229 [Hermetia illucens]CAD7090592.1 unnamed protein product [Hermetia illucens]